MPWMLIADAIFNGRPIQLYLTQLSVDSVRYVVQWAGSPGSLSLICMVHSFVLYRLDYGKSVLDHLPKSALLPFQRFQYSAARLILDLRMNDHVTPAAPLVARRPSSRYGLYRSRQQYKDWSAIRRYCSIPGASMSCRKETFGYSGPWLYRTRTAFKWTC